MSRPSRRDEATPSHARQWAALSLLAAYALIVALVTLTPTPVDRGFSSPLREVLTLLHRHGLPEWFRYGALEFSANILMFIPLTFALSLLMPFRLWWLPLLIGPALSVAIEVTQALLLSGRTPAQ